MDGIELTLQRSPTSPFGHIIDKLTVPAWMMPGLPADETQALPPVEDLQVFEGGFRFSVRGQPFRYDRHGLAQDGPRRQ